MRFDQRVTRRGLAFNVTADVATSRAPFPEASLAAASARCTTPGVETDVEELRGRQTALLGGSIPPAAPADLGLAISPAARRKSRRDCPQVDDGNRHDEVQQELFEVATQLTAIYERLRRVRVLEPPSSPSRRDFDDAAISLRASVKRLRRLAAELGPPAPPWQ